MLFPGGGEVGLGHGGFSNLTILPPSPTSLFFSEVWQLQPAQNGGFGRVVTQIANK